MRTSSEIAQAFSGHRFGKTYDSLSPDVRWVSVGGGTTEGRDAVIEVCEGTLRELADTTVVFPRFVVADGGDVVAIDSLGTYVDASGSATAVASCDIFEFREGLIVEITSYTVEVPPPAGAR